MQRQIIIATRSSPFRDALVRVCSGQGCRVETADAIATALEIAVRRPVCVLISDASVRDTEDGVGLAKAIRAQNREATCFLIVDEKHSAIADAVKDEPWIRLVPKPIGMLRFSADVVDAIAESQGEHNP